jgi:hypothetical protein
MVFIFSDTWILSCALAEVLFREKRHRSGIIVFRIQKFSQVCEYNLQNGEFKAVERFFCVIYDAP